MSQTKVWDTRVALVLIRSARLLTIAALVSQGKERKLRGHIGGALAQGITPDKITESIVQACTSTRG